MSLSPKDLIGKKVSFDAPGSPSEGLPIGTEDHRRVPTRLVGVIIEAKDNGKTVRGAIPDILIQVRGQSGKTLTVSFVDSYAKISEP